MEERRFSGVWVVIVAALLLTTPLLYVLSIGPYARLYCVGRPEPEWGPKFYAPLKWAVERSTTAEEWFSWYVELWLPDDFDDVIPYE
jgi:hypothetical protein